MDVKKQVNLYVYNSKNLKCKWRVAKVAEQICKNIDYPLHVRRVSENGESEPWEDFVNCTAFSLSNEEGCGIINGKINTFNFILVSYDSLCSPHTPGASWRNWLTMKDPDQVYQLDGDRIEELRKVCVLLSRKSHNMPDVILCDYHHSDGSNEMNEQKLEWVFRSYGFPDDNIIFLDKHDENKYLEDMRAAIVTTLEHTTVFGSLIDLIPRPDDTA
jgi:hypothetical protein